MNAADDRGAGGAAARHPGRGERRGPAGPAERTVESLVEIDDFNAFILQHQSLAYSVALRMLGSPEAAEDATQEAFLRAYRARARYHSGNARAWLMRIVTNTAIDELRRRRRRREQPFTTSAPDTDEPTPHVWEPPDPSPGPDAAALQSDLRRQLETALAVLSDDFRLVVVLHDIHGLTYDEIASVAGVPIGTVRSRLSRARGQLRDLLRGRMRAGELPSSPGAARGRS